MYRTYIITFFFLEGKKEFLILEATPSEPGKQEEDRYLRRRYSPAATAQPESHSSPLLTIIIAIQPLPTPTSYYIGDVMHSDNESHKNDNSYYSYPQ